MPFRFKSSYFIALTVLLLAGDLIVVLFILRPKVLESAKVQNHTPVSHVSNFPKANIPIDYPAEWTLLLTGDIIPARVVNQKMVANNDFMWPLEQIKDELGAADLTVINLESPLLNNCPVTNEGFKFCGDFHFARSLALSGVDVASLANNHTLNYGWDGLAETEKHLAEFGIETTGFTTLVSPPSLTLNKTIHSTENPSSAPITQINAIAQNCVENSFCSRFVVKKIKNISVGFLGYNAVGQPLDREISEQEIKKARNMVDVLVVSVHWGREYVREPEFAPGIAPDDPKELGRLFIGWGADIVHGNHPHWYQPFEFVHTEPSRSVQGKDGKDKVVFYALGNTVFDQEWSPETKVGYLARLHFTDTKLEKDKLDIIPIGLRDFGQAYLLEGEEKQKVQQYLLQ